MDKKRTSDRSANGRTNEGTRGGRAGRGGVDEGEEVPSLPVRQEEQSVVQEVVSVYDNTARKQEKDEQAKEALVSQGGAKRPGAVSETNGGSDTQYKKQTDANAGALRVIQPAQMKSPSSHSDSRFLLAADSPVPNFDSVQTSHTASNVGNIRTTGSTPATSNQRETKGRLRRIPPRPAVSASHTAVNSEESATVQENASSNGRGIAVARQVDETDREIAELQERLRAHETRDIVDGVPVSQVGKAKDNQDDDDNGRIRRLCILIGMLVIGGVVAVTLALVLDKPSSPLPITETPTVSPASTGGRHDTSSMPTSSFTSNKPSANPTQASSMPSVSPTWTPQPSTHAPSPSPTLSRRSYLLESLLSTTSFDTTGEWDEHLIANPETNQSQAFEWISQDDDYSSQPQTLSTVELQERYALVVFYFETSGSDWLRSEPYFLNSATSVCSWNSLGPIESRGVFCDDSNRISGIFLSDSELLGGLASEIVLLNHIESLHLWSNGLTGTLPPMPASLTSIDLSSNELSGTLPSDWGRTITNLHELELSGNYLTGSIPPEWGNFDQLKYLSFFEDYISGSIPTTIGLMTSLQWLWLEGCDFMTGTIPSEIGNLEQLEEIYFSMNGLVGTVPSEIGLLRNLSYLVIWSPTLTGFIPTEMGMLTNLRNIFFQGNDMAGTLPSEIGLMTSMTYIYVPGNNLSGTLPSEIALLYKTLTGFTVNNNPNISGTVPSEYARLRELDTLDLRNTAITGSMDTLCISEFTAWVQIGGCEGKATAIECSCCEEETC
eukprot:Nitzschia sp. Nitz4//scaffold214_size40253//7113//9449//NITZ4_007586-RA/size40253-processed-gene-0.69-mRNA-1//1//CDS//3329542096//3128//frame0